MKIAIDAMGGDNAPEAPVKGSVKAIKAYKNIDVILTGKEEYIAKFIPDENKIKNRIEIINCQQEVAMDEKPAKALRRKKDTSIGKAAELVDSGKAKALFSAGSTGASLAAGILKIGRISGIKRPAIASLFPSRKKPVLLLDMGANANCEPVYLLQFAIMAQIYASSVLKRENPSIGLMNVGEEKGKGNKMIDEAYQLLEKDERLKNFAGNIEGRDIFTGKYDIILCDGFVGNVILKTVEGMGDFLFDLLKESFQKNLRSKFAALLAKDSLKSMKKKVDYRQYGGAPMLGLKGNVIIGHGSSDDIAVKNAIKVAGEAIEKKIVSTIAEEIDKDGEEIDV